MGRISVSLCDALGRPQVDLTSLVGFRRDLRREQCRDDRTGLYVDFAIRESGIIDDRLS